MLGVMFLYKPFAFRCKLVESREWFVVTETGVLSYIAASGVGRSVPNLLWLCGEEEGEAGDLARFFLAICLLTGELSFNQNWWHAPDCSEHMRA